MVGTGLLLLVVALTMQPLQSSIAGAVEDQGLAGAVTAGVNTVLGSLRTGILVVVVLAVVAAAVLYLTGQTRGADAADAPRGRHPASPRHTANGSSEAAPSSPSWSSP